MISKLSLIAVLALLAGAVTGTGSASASAFVADEYPAAIKGVESTVFELIRGNVRYGCDILEFETAIQETAFTLDATEDVNWWDCYSPSAGGETKTIEMNGCGLIYHPGMETDEGEFAGTMDIGPPGCGPIVIDLTKTPCMPLKIPAQTGISATYQNVGEETVLIEVDTALEFLPPEAPFCGSGQGWWTGTWEVTAKNEETEEPLGLQIDQTGVYTTVAQTGVYTTEEGFDAEAFPVSLSGDQDGSHEFKRTNRRMACESADFSQDALAETSSQLQLEVVYDDCFSPTLGESSVVTTETNGCGYELDAGGVVGIDCPEGEAIELRVYSSQNNYEEDLPVCVYEIGPQEGLEAAEYSTVGEGNERGIEVDLELAGVSSVRAQGAALFCGAAEDSSGTYTGSLTLFGNGPAFGAEAFPVSLSGDQDGSHEFKRTNRRMACESADFSQDALAETSSQLQLEVVYDDCFSPTLGESSVVTAETNGCGYALAAGGLVGIDCPEGEAIELRVYSSQNNYEEDLPVCVYEIGPQEGLEAAEYSTVGEGNERGIEVDLELTGVSSVRAQGSALFCGAAEDSSGTYTGGFTLHGAELG